MGFIGPYLGPNFLQRFSADELVGNGLIEKILFKKDERRLDMVSSLQSINEHLILINIKHKHGSLVKLVFFQLFAY